MDVVSVTSPIAFLEAIVKLIVAAILPVPDSYALCYKKHSIKGKKKVIFELNCKTNALLCVRTVTHYFVARYP